MTEHIKQEGENARLALRVSTLEKSRLTADGKELPASEQALLLQQEWEAKLKLVSGGNW